MDKKVALCMASVAHESGQKPEFEISWDRLVMAVGEQTATFGVPGVEEHCFFMKATLTTSAYYLPSFLGLEIQHVTTIRLLHLSALVSKSCKQIIMLAIFLPSQLVDSLSRTEVHSCLRHANSMAVIVLTKRL
jgi:hypothetical protein